MSDDPRCCGSGTCIIDLEGRCWCGQQWDGNKMCLAPLDPLNTVAAAESVKDVVRAKSEYSDVGGNSASNSDVTS